MFYLQLSRPLKALHNHQISNSHVSPSLILQDFVKVRYLLHQVNILILREKERDLLNYLSRDEKKIPYVTHPLLGCEVPAEPWGWWWNSKAQGPQPRLGLDRSHHTNTIAKVEMNHPSHWLGLASLQFHLKTWMIKMKRKQWNIPNFSLCSLKSPSFSMSVALTLLLASLWVTWRVIHHCQGIWLFHHLHKRPA